jgi:large subunit ribosomal protein L31e
MKSDEVKLDQDLNRQIWSRGKTNPPRNVRVKMTKDEDGVVTVSLYEDLPVTEEAPAVEKKAEPAETTAAAEEPAPEAKAEEKTETPAK